MLPVWKQLPTDVVNHHIVPHIVNSDVRWRWRPINKLSVHLARQRPLPKVPPLVNRKHPFAKACAIGDLQTVDKLIADGLNPNDYSWRDRLPGELYCFAPCPLVIAAIHRQVHIVEYLLDDERIARSLDGCDVHGLVTFANYFGYDDVIDAILKWEGSGLTCATYEFRDPDEGEYYIGYWSDCAISETMEYEPEATE